MGAAIATGMCCCFSCCCQEASESCKRWLGPERVTKIFYFFLVIVFTIPAMIIFFFLNQWQQYVSYFQEWIKCPQSSGSTDQLECVGGSAIFRLSLSLLCLFFMMMIFMAFRSRCSMILNEGLFCFKYLFVVGLFIGFLWVPNQTFINYGIASQYISIAFMILQAIILIDLFYLAGIRLVKRYDEGQSQYACYLVTLTVLAEGGAITLNILGYVFTYYNVNTGTNFEEGCTNTLWVNIVTSLILIVLPVIQLFHCNPQNSLLTTSLISMYISYLAMISQFSYSNGNPVCNRMGLGPLIGDVIVSTFFFVVTMYGSVMGGSGQVKVTSNGDVNKAIGVAPTEARQNNQEEEGYKKPANPNEEQENEEKYTQSCVWVKWHFYMCLAAVYIGMLITNWNPQSLENIGDTLHSEFGFWVRVAISWLTFILYIWTLIAPRVCPDRDFTVE